MQLADLDSSWAGIVDEIVAMVVAGQFYGASMAYAYQIHHLHAAGLSPKGPTLLPRGFTGLAASGAPLAEPLALAPIRVKQALKLGVTGPQALNAGLAQVTGVADSELQEAARGVMDVGLNTEPQYRGYLRHPNPGACGRCLILANKFYRSNDGFERHPRCSCTHEPVLVGQELVNLPDARERFVKLSKAEQDKAFGADGADAIRNGADPASIQNARAGMTKAGESYTTQGLSRRSLSGKRLETQARAVAAKHGRRYTGFSRLSPAGCRKVADGDQEQYLHLLKLNGYIL